ncbi:hypothetical protein [Verminephrobacter aporrectodeae]|uniref:hypothetical protein n=1 Tax=Verminephrobacter aporrectodeae TaxID=1110389 RepID=UPI002242E177|nr:hypothetical protein [Verminephrobacter aporrectodeae]
MAEAKPGVSRSTIYRPVKESPLDLAQIDKRSCGITADSTHTMIARNKAPRQHHGAGTSTQQVPEIKKKTLEP